MSYESFEQKNNVERMLDQVKELSNDEIIELMGRMKSLIQETPTKPTEQSIIGEKVEAESEYIGYKEYDKKFQYFDQGDGTTFTPGENDTENGFSYNSETGEVLPLSAGWAYISTNPNLFLSKSFDYGSREIFTTPAEKLKFKPAKLDKNGRIIQKGEISLS